MLIEGIHHLTTLTAELDRTTVPLENAEVSSGGTGGGQRRTVAGERRRARLGGSGRRRPGRPRHESRADESRR